MQEADPSTLRDAVRRLWPELDWINDATLRAQVEQTWVRAFELSALAPEDLNRIPFTLLVPNCPTTFMEHKRCVVHIARQAAESMQKFMGNALKINMDTVIAGAILADVGKLLEYETGPDGPGGQESKAHFLIVLRLSVVFVFSVPPSASWVSGSRLTLSRPTLRPPPGAIAPEMA
jgi:hypothetical protein